MEFDKYHTKSDYHWQQYLAGTIYTKHIAKMKSLVRKGRILDVGAGDGVLTWVLDADGIDNNEEAVRLAQVRGSNVKLGSAYELSGTYDSVVFSDVLEHLQYPERALTEVKKVLAEDGLLYIIAPPPRHNKPRKYHYQEWTADGLVEFMKENEFECVSIETVFAHIRVYGVFKLLK